MNKAEVTPQMACHRPIRTVRGLWTVKGATGGNLPIAGEDMLHVLLIPEFCPGRQRLTCGQTLSTNQMRPWD